MHSSAQLLDLFVGTLDVPDAWVRLARLRSIPAHSLLDEMQTSTPVGKQYSNAALQKHALRQPCLRDAAPQGNIDSVEAPKWPS